MPQVDDVMARINFSGLLSNGRSDWPIIGEGVEPDKEAVLGTQVRYVEGRQLAKNDQYGVVLGEGIAHALKLRTGDRATLLLNTAEGALNSLEFEVVGIFQSFSKDYDARAVRIPLVAAHELLGTKGVNSLVVSLKRTEDTRQVANALAGQLDSKQFEVKTWQQLNDFYESTVALYERQFGVLQFIILVMVLLSVANSVNMGVLERVGEFGTMMALGNRSGLVLRLVLTENVLLGLFGATLGLVLGIFLAWAISAIGIPMPPPPNANRGYTAHILILVSDVGESIQRGLFRHRARGAPSCEARLAHTGRRGAAAKLLSKPVSVKTCSEVRYRPDRCCRSGQTLRWVDHRRCRPPLAGANSFGTTTRAGPETASRRDSGCGRAMRAPPNCLRACLRPARSLRSHICFEAYPDHGRNKCAGKIAG